MNYHGFQNFFNNVCPGSCDPNCQFSHAFVVVDCYKILDRKDVEPHARHPPQKKTLDSRSIIIQQQKQIWSCFMFSIDEIKYIYIYFYLYGIYRYLYPSLLLVVLFKLHFDAPFWFKKKSLPFFWARGFHQPPRG